MRLEGDSGQVASYGYRIGWVGVDWVVVGFLVEAAWSLQGLVELEGCVDRGILADPRWHVRLRTPLLWSAKRYSSLDDLVASDVCRGGRGAIHSSFFNPPTNWSRPSH